MSALTGRQIQVLQVIHNFIDDHGFSPSVQDIVKRLDLSPNSSFAVRNHIDHLEEKELVTRAHSKSRTIKVTAKGLALLAGDRKEVQS